MCCRCFTNRCRRRRFSQREGRKEYANLAGYPPCMTRKIAIIGPESTGKSTLSRELAACYGAGWVPEYAREYLQELPRKYEEADLLHIAHGQLGAEECVAERENVLFCDTDLYVV